MHMKIKQMLAGLVILALVVPSIVLPTTALAADQIFEDTFNSGLGAWVAGTHWEIDNNYVKVSGQHTDSSLAQNISTAGYENLNLAFRYRVPQRLESGDHLIAEWSANGTTWAVLSDYTNLQVGSALLNNVCGDGTDSDSDGLTDWDDPDCDAVSVSFNLPAEANNQAGFAIRFRSTFTGANADEFQLDDVALTGDELPPVVVNEPPTITILGTNPTTTVQNLPYVDEGATATDTEDGDLTASITITPELPLDTSATGTKEIVYSVTDLGGLTGYATRTVAIIEPPTPPCESECGPNQPPTLTILGANPTTTVKDLPYTDQGATADDGEGNDITGDILVTGLPIDTSATGTYQVVYSVTDLGGLTDYATRTVNVVAPEDVPASFSISGFKFNDRNADNNWDPQNEPPEEGLSGWVITLAKKVAGPTIVNSNGLAAFTPIMDLAKEYLLNASGTFNAADSITADAQYSVREPNTEWTDIVQNYEGYGPTLLNLFIDGTSADWGAYTNTHSYWLPITGHGTSSALSIYDIAAENNTGSLNVDLYEIIATTTTDHAGAYSFVDLESGDYVVRETNQHGWTQTYPEGDGTNKVTLTEASSTATNINFGNDQVGIGEGEACGYKFNDLNNNGVWDEGSESGLGGIVMKLFEMNSDEIDQTRSDTTDENGRYCFSIGNAAGENVLGEEEGNGWTATIGLPQTIDVEDVNGSYEFTPVGNYRQPTVEPEDGGGSSSSGGCRPCAPCDRIRTDCPTEGTPPVEDAPTPLDTANTNPAPNQGGNGGFGQGGAEGGLTLLTDGPGANDNLAIVDDGAASTTASTTDEAIAGTDQDNNQLAAVGLLDFFGFKWYWWLLLLILLGLSGYYTFRNKEGQY